MLNDGDWKGQPCAVLGGGPSLRGVDLSALQLGRVIAVNFAYELCPNAACVITEDVRFIQLASRKKSWQDFQGEKILSCLEPSYEPLARAAEPKIRIVPRKSSVRFWSKSIADGFSYSSCSLIPALNLADILGADPIYLLGVDLNPIPEGKPTNFHDHYTKAPGFERVQNQQLEDFRKDLEVWAAPKLSHRRILNLNKNSAVQCWPRLSFEEAFGDKKEVPKMQGR